MSTMLTKDFALEEFTFSQTATRLGINNTPSEGTLDNIKHVAYNLQNLKGALQDYYNRKVFIKISSGYRSPKLNTAIKGAKASSHLEGLAVDMSASGLTTEEFFLFIKDIWSPRASSGGIDQCIQEFDGWVHLSFAKHNSRGEFLRAQRGTSLANDKTVYTPA